MPRSLTDIAGETDARARSVQFREYVEGAVKEVDVGRLQGVVAQVADDLVPQAHAGQLLSEYAQAITALPDATYLGVAEQAVTTLAPREYNFVMPLAAIRERLSQALERGGRPGAAADALVGIPFDAVTRAPAGHVTRGGAEQYRVYMYVRIAGLFVKEGARRVDDAEPWANRAHPLQPVADAATKLHFRLLQAQIADYKKRYADAATKYYRISQQPPGAYGRAELTAADTTSALEHAVACGILAPAGPRRSRVLAALYNDGRARGTRLYNVLADVHMGRLLTADAVAELRGALLPHQCEAVVEGENALDRAVVEHNLLAASKLYLNVGLGELADLLRVDVHRAESTAVRMIGEKRMSARIDQVCGSVQFTRNDQAERIEAWDAHIESLCASVDTCVDAIINKHPQFAS